MLIDLAIKVVEPVGKAVLALVRKRESNKPQAASITYYTSGGDGDHTDPEPSEKRLAA